MANTYPNNFSQNNSYSLQPQQLFPQPQGSVYLINNSLEVANVPMSAGLSVGICLPEEILYLKSIQNGNPVLMAYKITPYTPQKEQGSQTFEDRLAAIENKLEEIFKAKKGNFSELM